VNEEESKVNAEAEADRPTPLTPISRDLMVQPRNSKGIAKNLLRRYKPFHVNPSLTPKVADPTISAAENPISN
jgi:hypothetical protein